MPSKAKRRRHSRKKTRKLRRTGLKRRKTKKNYSGGQGEMPIKYESGKLRIVKPLLNPLLHNYYYNDKGEKQDYGNKIPYIDKWNKTVKSGKAEFEEYVTNTFMVDPEVFLASKISQKFTIGPKYRLILDTDPGCDDSLFIACCISSVYLLRQQKIDIKIRGITIVYGNNNSVELLARAAARILLECKVDTNLKDVLSKNFKLVMGNSLPGKDSPGTFVHGEFGLGNVNPDENDEWKTKIDAFLRKYGSNKTKNNNAAEFIKETLQKATKPNEEIYILAVGPLTNISDTFNLLTDDSDGKIQSNLKELVIMGGSVGMGNTAPLVEANWMNDPSAVDNVLKKFQGKITWVPLNFTHQLNIIRVVEYFKELIRQESVKNVHLLQLFCNIFERYIEALTGKIVKAVIENANDEQISIRLFDTTIGYKTKFRMDDKSIYDKVFEGTKLTDDLFPNGIEQYGLPLHDGSAMLAFFFDGMIEFENRYISIDTEKTTYNWGSPEDAKEVAGKVHMFEKQETNSSPLRELTPTREVNLAYQPKMPSGIEDIHKVFVNLILYLNKQTTE